MQTKVSLAYRHVLFWGGLRGAISLALALSLPLALADREILRVMTFGVVLFTLLAQGTTMQFLLRRLGIGVAPPLELEYERRHGRLIAAQAAFRRIKEMYLGNLFSLTIWQELEPELQKQIADALESQNELLKTHPELQSEEREDAQRESLNAQRAALAKMLSGGLISDVIYDELVTEVDQTIASLSEHESTSEKTPEAV